MTSTETWSLLIAIAASVGTFYGAYQAIKAVTNDLTAPDKTRDKLIDDNARRIGKLENKYELLRKELEEKKDLDRLLLTAIQQLLKSSIDGNNKKGLEDANNEIDQYLKSKI